MPTFRVTAQLEKIMGSVEVEAADEAAALAMITGNEDFETWISKDFEVEYAQEQP